MYRPLAVAAAAAAVLAVGGVAFAAPTTGPTVPTPVTPTAAAPGPKQPIEHLGLSGGYFDKKSGNPGCFTGAGTLGASFPVPRGALITGLTAYATDSQANGNVFVTLNRHDLASGGTYRLGTANTTGAPGTVTVEIKLNPAVSVNVPSSTNVDVTVGDGTCFKGAELHFIRNPASVAAPPPDPTAARPQPTRMALAPDSAPTR